ncbi:MAG: hypothetical protein V1901_03805 [Patescibacteria group bacterium]
MESKIILKEGLINYVFDQQASSIVGKVCKRFELSDNKDEIKKQVKELLYEFMRDLKKLLIIAEIEIKPAIHIEFKE